MKTSIMTAAVLALAVSATPAFAQMSPQTSDQSMPTAPSSQQPTPGQMGTETAPTPGADAGMATSDADKRKMASCMKKSHDAMMKDSKCAAMMEAHPEMMSKPN